MAEPLWGIQKPKKNPYEIILSVIGIRAYFLQNQKQKADY